MGNTFGPGDVVRWRWSLQGATRYTVVAVSGDEMWIQRPSVLMERGSAVNLVVQTNKFLLAEETTS